MNKANKQTPLFVPFAISALIFLIFFLLEILFYTFELPFWLILIILAAGSATAGFLISFGLSTFAPVFSSAMMTWRQLFRFESFSHPLLLRLSYEAPGTFHHSINVSILSQKAAKKIGGDALLVRVAAYYHDLGKLDNPAEFIENQSGTEIPDSEDADSIRQDAKKIIAHVKKGIDLALTNHLPEEVINLIGEHHGTTRVLYFYEKAKERGLKIKKTDFKYDGPAPQSKEAAILMLADSCEAATRAVPDLTKEKIISIVENTFEDKICEGQFENANISTTELSMVKDSLIETLGSIYHQRIIERKYE